MMKVLARNILPFLVGLLFLSTVPANAIEKIYGLNVGFYVDDQDPNEGVFVSQDQIRKRLAIIAPYTYLIRSFSCASGLEEIGPIAREFGLLVAAGAWLSTDAAQSRNELNNLSDICKRGGADVAIIGSEVLYRKDFSANQLIAYINYFREITPNVLVAVADSYDVLEKNPAVINASDIVLLNVYPYWEGIAVENAVKRVHEVFKGFQKDYPEKYFAIGETGWPSAGDTIGAAVPSDYNAAWYFLDITSWSKIERVVVIQFAAFDELWKAKREGPQGSHWGIWDKDGKLKILMQYTFDGWMFPKHW
jgi:exo-beta-1,3-glucanase (GH17 family)